MKIAVIGAGVAGLAAGYDLARAGHEVTIFEAASFTGGLAAGFKSERWAWHLEQFYHHWFESDKDILALIDEIGQGHKVFFPRPTTSLYVDGEIYPFDSPLRMLFFPKLPLIPKLRFGLIGLYLRLTRNWQALEKETAHNWTRRMMGEEAYKIIWEPLLVGKFGDYYKDVNMAWLWARIHKRSYKLGYFEGGFQAFIDALTETLRGLGVKICLNARIGHIGPTVGGALQVRLDAATGEAETFERILVTVSPQLLNHLVPDLPGDYLAALSRLKSMGAVVVILALQHRLTQDHYWINLPKGEGLPFLALVEHTNFIDPAPYDHDHIIYCGDYLKPDHEYFRLTKEELLARFLPALRRFNPNFEESWVKESWLFGECELALSD
jgi:protoporphyrinogen oxidase